MTYTEFHHLASALMENFLQGIAKQQAYIYIWTEIYLQ